MASPFLSARAILAAFSNLPASLFNGAKELVRLDSLGRLPAIDGSQLTNVNSAAGPTFGVGGTYATAAAAIADGKFNLRCVGNATESVDLVFTQTTNIVIDPDAEWTLGTNRIAFGANNIDLIIKGTSPLVGVLKWSPVIAGSLVNDGGFNGIQLAIEDLTIDQSGSVASCPVFASAISGSVLLSGAVEILLPNAQGCGIHSGATQKIHSTGVLTIKRSGVGTNCFNVLSGAANISTLILDGAFKSGSTTATTGAGVVRQLICQGSANDFIIAVGGDLFSARCTGGGAIDLNVAADGVAIRGVDLSGGDLDLGAHGFLSIDGVKSSGSLVMASASCSSNNVLGCRFDGALIMAGNDNKIITSSFLGGYTDSGSRNARIGVVDATGGMAITDSGVF